MHRISGWHLLAQELEGLGGRQSSTQEEMEGPVGVLWLSVLLLACCWHHAIIPGPGQRMESMQEKRAARCVLWIYTWQAVLSPLGEDLCV